jgi:hypothetical protein
MSPTEYNYHADHSMRGPEIRSMARFIHLCYFTRARFEKWLGSTSVVQHTEVFLCLCFYTIMYPVS